MPIYILLCNSIHVHIGALVGVLAAGVRAQ